jgi:hypothetical protein
MYQNLKIEGVILMEKIIIDLLEIAKLDENFIISSGVLYLTVKQAPTITTYLDAEGNSEHKETINIISKEICTIRDIRAIGYDLKTITIVTKDYKITINSAWCNITPV